MVRARSTELIGIYRLRDFLQSFPGFSAFLAAVSLNSTNRSFRKEEYQQTGQVAHATPHGWRGIEFERFGKRKSLRGITFSGETQG
jgi:hypothetical protein